VKVWDALAECVEEEGTRALFGLMGDGNLYFMARLLERGVTEVFDVRHEGSAVAMADGYARVSGEVGVASVTSGPGVTHLGSSLTVANRTGTPLVVIAGEIPAMSRGMGTHRQETNQRAFAEASGALFHQLRDVSTVASDVQRAFWLARTHRRPVLLNCPIDMQAAEFPGELTYTPSGARLFPLQRLAPDADAIEKAADLIVSARRPVIVAGLGAIAADAHAAIEALGDRIGSVNATTLRAKGYLEGGWSVGLCGNFSTLPAQAILADADLVILVGASGSTDTAEAVPARARTIQINNTGTVGVGNRIPNHLVFSDAKLALEAILELLVEADYTSVGYRGGSYAATLALDPVETDLQQAQWNVPPDTVDPRRFIRYVDPLLPDPCTIVIGGGHNLSFPCMFLSGGPSRRYVFTYDFGCIGQGIPNAFGAAVANPDHPVVLFEGDASALMTIHDLDVTARYHPRLLVFIMNDGALGAEYHKLQTENFNPKWAQVRTPDFGRLAEAFGNTGGTVRSLSDIDEQVDLFERGTGARYVDVHIPVAVVSAPFRGMFPALAPAVATPRPVTQR
jgi:acetolactate synthase I/II/III large subunit